METIGVADLEKYWITFEQLLQRWQIKEELLVLYCVRVDTSKGHPPLVPHFYQGEFPISGDTTWKRLAKYKPEYKNATEFLSKCKTESQLVQEFLASISDVKKDRIWFLLSDVEGLESADCSLRLAARASSSTSNITVGLDYITLDAPITFEEILTLWIGKDKYEEIKSYDPDEYFFPVHPGPDFDYEYLSLIRAVENQLDSALRNCQIHLFNKRKAAGREFYYKVTYDQGGLFARTREGYGAELNKCFQFMSHYPDLAGAESEPLYFDGNEVFQKFPFLKQCPPKEPNNSSPESVTLQAVQLPLIPVNIPASLWAGKTPEMVYTALKNEFSLEVIAMVMDLVSENKTECGRALAKEDIDKGEEKDARTYQRNFDNFLCRGNAKYLLTFNE